MGNEQSLLQKMGSSGTIITRGDVYTMNFFVNYDLFIDGRFVPKVADLHDIPVSEEREMRALIKSKIAKLEHTLEENIKVGTWQDMTMV